VPATNLVPLPDSIGLDAAAMIEPASTAFHALAARAPSIAGEAVAIVGVGGLGLQAVALASLLGAAAVVAVDLDERALELALEHGATAVYDANNPDVARSVRTATGGGAAVAVECVGNGAACATAFACLRSGGTVVIVGVGDEVLGGPTVQRFVAHEYEARGSFAYSQDEVERVISLAEAGRLDLGAAIGERFPLHAIETAVERVRAGVAKPGRILIAD
jgi:threonine dehydrogenase-like Zn-dependent dehydrogenase